MPAAWIHSDPNADDGYYRDDRQRECSRGDHCSDPRPVDEGGKTVLRPALTPRAFCEVDRGVIGQQLADLPRMWAAVHSEIGNKGTANGPKVSSSRTPPLPISLSVDALLRDVEMVLNSWDERVRQVARLVTADTTLNRRASVSVRTACIVLAAHLDTLLSLDDEPMLRYFDLNQLPDLPPGTPGLVHIGAEYAEVLLDLNGADAGLEVLNLHYRCRKLLSETRPPARHVPVPCRQCGYRSLYERRTWDDQADGARCRHCGLIYEDNDFALYRGEVYAAEQARRAVNGAPANHYGLAAAESDYGSGRA